MIVRIYTGPDNQSHFEDLDILPPGLETTDLQAVKGITFARRPAGNVMDWHHAPARQYVIGLGGETEITVGDGTSRRLGPGRSQESRKGGTPPGFPPDGFDGSQLRGKLHEVCIDRQRSDPSTQPRRQNPNLRR